MGFLNLIFGTSCKDCGDTIQGMIYEKEDKYYCRDCYNKFKKIEREKENEHKNKLLNKKIRDGFKGTILVTLTHKGKIEYKIKIPWIYYLKLEENEEDNMGISSRVSIAKEIINEIKNLYIKSGGDEDAGNIHILMGFIKKFMDSKISEGRILEGIEKENQFEMSMDMGKPKQTFDLDKKIVIDDEGKTRKMTKKEIEESKKDKDKYFS